MSREASGRRMDGWMVPMGGEEGERRTWEEPEAEESRVAVSDPMDHVQTSPGRHEDHDSTDMDPTVGQEGFEPREAMPVVTEEGFEVRHLVPPPTQRRDGVEDWRGLTCTSGEDSRTTAKS